MDPRDLKHSGLEYTETELGVLGGREVAESEAGEQKMLKGHLPRVIYHEAC